MQFLCITVGGNHNGVCAVRAALPPDPQVYLWVDIQTENGVSETHLHIQGPKTKAWK